MIFGVETTIAAEVSTVAAGTEENGATVSITKELEFAEGLEIPEVTFQFIATPIT